MEKGESSTSDELRPFIKRAVAKMAQSVRGWVIGV